MRPNTDRTPVKCVACRIVYVPASSPSACPQCGCASWVAAWIVDEPRKAALRLAL